MRVKWIRQPNGHAIPCYKEHGDLRWKPYTLYPNRKPDDFGSPGMATFRLWLKMGAELEPGVGECN